MKKIYHANSNQKIGEVPILISEKINLRNFVGYNDKDHPDGRYNNYKHKQLTGPQNISLSIMDRIKGQQGNGRLE